MGDSGVALPIMVPWSAERLKQECSPLNYSPSSLYGKSRFSPSYLDIEALQECPSLNSGPCEEGGRKALFGTTHVRQLQENFLIGPCSPIELAWPDPSRRQPPRVMREVISETV